MNYNKTLNLPKTKFSMKANLSNREPEIQKIWKNLNIYKKILENNKENSKFVLHDGPPYANGHIHLGHALNRVLKDMVIKYKSMRGYYTPFIPGWDCHGLPVEYELIKRLGPRETENKLKFRKKAAQYALKFVNIQKKEFIRLGLFGDWENPYLTLNKDYEEKIIDSFKNLYLMDYIYRELKPVYWCSSCQTALAEAEVEYKDIQSPSIYIKFKMDSKKPEFINKDEKIFALVWTTTPWTLPSNVALCFHPDFKYSYIKKDNEYLIVADKLSSKYPDYKVVKTVKGKEFLNAEFISPFGSVKSKGINGEFVSLEEGTGIVHIAPGHGEEDYLIGKEYDLPVLSPVDEKGRFTDDAGVEDIVGKQVFESDSVIIKQLSNRGLLFKKEEVFHSYPHCWRCKNPVIFRATEQWFLAIDRKGLRNKILEKIKKVKWIPEVSRKRITAMIENRPDWCLSRQRIWGVPIPVFYCNKCNKVIATQESFKKVIEMVKEKGTDGWFELSASEILGNEIKCKCGSKDIRKEEDILDVWFDSGVSHFAVLENRKDVSWPSDMYLEGSDQHRGWFQTSIIPSVAIRQEPPYRSVFTHGFIVDAEGKKMSKSIGNVISPQEIVEKYGADLLRLWVSSENYFKDVKISQEILSQMVTYYRRIRNSLRFILGNTRDLTKRINLSDMNEIDKYMIHRLKLFYDEVIENYNEFLFYKSTRIIHDFCNNWLSSFYFNIIKDRLYVMPENSIKRRSSQTALILIGEVLLKLLSPVLSHTAEEGWQTLKNQNKQEDIFYPDSVLFSKIEDPSGEWENKSLEKKWEKIIDLRDLVLKRIEQEKNKEKFKDPLESEVEITASSEDMFSFENNPEEKFKEYFIVSRVNINVDKDLKDGEEWNDGKIKITVKKASGDKCVRCWLISKEVGSDHQHPQLCNRCAEIINKHFR
ncbi:MAG: isoleucine--tRNA ligase [Elusimicrobiota bacterium]